MGYEPDGGGGMFEKTSGKTLAVLFGLAFFGAFMLLQVIWGFPIIDLFVKKTVTEDAKIAIKDGNVCIVETSDRTPRRIEDCPYSAGDPVTVTYSEGRAGIESHRPRE
ncbi:MAG: hypothetical protein ACREAI_01765 [Nitrososphaera sp.]